MGKGPDAMLLIKYRGKINKYTYAKYSHIICNNTKKANDEDMK